MLTPVDAQCAAVYNAFASKARALATTHRSFQIFHHRTVKGRTEPPEATNQALGSSEILTSATLATMTAIRTGENRSRELKTAIREK